MTRDTYILLRAFVDELARCGMRAACTAPGSRSTPVVLALVRDGRLRCYSHLDERVAGFFALGLAKAGGLPVAVACTSGTAAAELAPAVYEAREARLPLLVLTADRPPELRDVGAGQTIDQLKLYGVAAKWFVEVGTHEATPDRLRWIRSLACRAFWTAATGRRGPVHLNFPLREPLVLDEGETLPEDDSGRAGGRPWLTRPLTARLPADSTLEALDTELGERRNGVVVAGRDERHPELPGAIARFAQRTGYALLADPLSGPRRAPERGSPTTTPSCATRASPPRTTPIWSCAWGTCRRPSRCASGSRATRRRCRSGSTPRRRGRTPTGSSAPCSSPTRRPRWRRWVRAAARSRA